MTGTGTHAEGRPRLIVLATTFPASAGDGVPAFVLDIAREQAREFDVTVIVPRVPGAAAREIVDGVDVRRFAYFPRRWERLANGAILDNLKAKRSNWLQVAPLMLAQIRALRRATRELRPAAVHAHWVIPAAVAARFGAPSVPLLVTTHGGDIYALNRPPISGIKRSLLRRAGAVTTVNEEMAARLHSWGVSADHISVLPMGVPLQEAAAVRSRVEPEPGRVTVVGRLVEKKGFGGIIRSVSTLESGSADLTIVGDGPLRADLERDAAGAASIRFLGQLSRDRVLEEMGRSSVFAVPSVAATSGDQEGLPVVLLEAAAMGCAIVASDLPGINEAMTDGVDAILVPPGDVDALRDAIARLLADPALRARLGTAARKRAAHYSLDRVGEQYRAAVRAAIEGANS